MTTSKEAFEAWARNDPERDFDLTTNFIGGVDWYLCSTTRQAWNDWRDATDACDAHWREKLQSDEMVEVAAHSLTDFLMGEEMAKDEAESVIAAISKEMGV